jgi:phosphorylcholine metabolism protein LicD
LGFSPLGPLVKDAEFVPPNALLSCIYPIGVESMDIFAIPIQQTSPSCKYSIEKFETKKNIFEKNVRKFVSGALMMQNFAKSIVKRLFPIYTVK